MSRGTWLSATRSRGLSPATFPSLDYAARAFNDPPGGLFQGEGTLFAGTGVQLGTGNRWGDYSSLMIDPVDDCTFWYTSQYYTTDAQFAWHSRIGTFKFPTCTAPAQGTLAGTITDCDGGATFDASMVMVAGGPSAGFSATSNADGTYSTKLAPGDYTVTVSSAPHGCTLAGPFNVTIIDGETTTLDACLTGTPNIAFMSSAVSGGNGNGVIDSNECNDLSVTLMVSGCATARHVSASLSTTTPGVTITQPNSPYPDAQVGQTATNTVPFSVSTGPGFVCGTLISFTLNVTFDGGSNVLSFSSRQRACSRR